MRSNLFISSGTLMKNVKIGYYTINSEIPPDEYYKITKGAEWYLFNRDHISSTYDNKIIFIENDSELEENITIGGYVFILSSEVIELNSEDHNFVLANLINNAFKRKVFSLEYQGPESQKYFKKVPYKTNLLSYYDAFYYDIEVFKDGRIGIWLDITTKWKLYLIDFLRWAQNQTQLDIREYLIGKKIKCPSVAKNKLFKAKIVDIENINIKEYTFKLENAVYNIYEWWTKKSIARI